MSFYDYVKDKRYFLALYGGILLFVSLLMAVSGSPLRGMGNILYMNVACLLAVTAYLAVGYRYRRSFYRELSELLTREGTQTAAALPEPQTAEQRLFVGIINKIQREHMKQMQRVISEHRDHQDFILSWIHEVKLPIAASRLVMENGSNKSPDELIDKLEDELGKIDNYVEQALYYSRIDSFSKDYFISEVPLEAVLKESVKKFAKLFITKRIRLRLDETYPYIHSDRKWLVYIIDQIMANALKYTPEDGAITIRLEEDAYERRLRIEDTGIGIKQEDLPRVFDKGFTGTNGRSYAKSTGMGLYLAKQMAIKLGSDLSILSEEGRYTRVTVHFPRAGTYLHWKE